MDGTPLQRDESAAVHIGSLVIIRHNDRTMIDRRPMDAGSAKTPKPAAIERADPANEIPLSRWRHRRSYATIPQVLHEG
jgi:hypothetical protein